MRAAAWRGAHAIHNGLTVLEECHGMYHGEKVAFGTIAQLVLENAPAKELEEIIDFCIELGLPVTLKQLGAEHITEEQIFAVAEAACGGKTTPSAICLLKSRPGPRRRPLRPRTPTAAIFWGKIETQAQD